MAPPRRRRPRYGEQSKCRFCRLKMKGVDYKDIATLQKLTTPQGKLFSRKRSGNCSFHQRSLKESTIRARFLGMLPFSS